MKNLIYTFLLLLSTSLFAQQSPKIILQDSSTLKLAKLKIDVVITGNYATTTYDMAFYNSTDRTLEGELAFPLADGQQVHRFALEINEKLREAVVVEKEKARVAFENTVRQNIDPAMLEKTQGNNYKARVYPILPKSYKRIVLSYEEPLVSHNNEQTLTIPLQIEEKLDLFKLEIKAFTENPIRIQNNKSHQLFFKNEAGVSIVNTSYKNHLANTPITVAIKQTENTTNVVANDHYFYAYKRMQPEIRLKKKPEKITLLWDVSYSAQFRDIEKEIALINTYFTYLNNVDVTLVKFNNAIISSEKFIINFGNIKDLKKALLKTNYDGGTAYSHFTKKDFKADEVLLFTDGLSNLGDFVAPKNTKTYTINSRLSANHNTLNNIATLSGGSYINLSKWENATASKILKTETLQFLGIKADKEIISEVFPKKNTNVNADFSIAGNFTQNTTIELLFGYGDKVTSREKTIINDSNNSPIAKRRWAQEKLKHLLKDKKNNRDAIVKLGTKYGLVTDYTSMIVLDRVEDYVRYKIEPPAELKAAYKELLEQQQDFVDEEEIQDVIEDLNEDYNDIIAWYNKEFPKHKKKIEKEKKIIVEIAQTNTPPAPAIPQNTEPNTVAQPDTIEDSNNPNNATLKTVTGTILDEDDLPLPGASVIIKGTNIGTQTDFDGNFSIMARVGQILTISYIGFNTLEQNITSSNYQINLYGDSSQLEEVVISAYTIRNRTAETSAVVAIASEEIAQVMQGKASGVNITNNNGQAEANNLVITRGLSGLSTSSSPLYIVDGVPVNEDPIKTLEPSEILSMQVIKDTDAIALYGSKASNGIIIIKTKAGAEENKEIVAALDKKINEQITLKPWNPETPYLEILKKETSLKNAYSKYLEIRDTYPNNPTFFIDVSQFFKEKGQDAWATTILANLLEMDLDNHELMRAIAYKLESYKQYELAVFVYKNILELRPEEPQSYRDLALAYQKIEAYQKSFDLLYRLYQGELRFKDLEERFYGIENIAFVELNHLVTKHKNAIKIPTEAMQNFTNLNTDIRIVIDWNHNDTDIDLWITDPNGEKVSYSNTLSNIGGRISEDMTDGYGPEEFLLKKAIKGEYIVEVDYFADHMQKISGPTSLKVTMFTNYGKKNETSEITIVRLDQEKEDIEVGRVKF